VRPRHAASLIVLRQAISGFEVLMGTRGAKARFMPNRLVFPGGAVDPADYRARAAAPLRPHTLDYLTRGATPRLAHALAIAAARELEEETGLTLGHPPHLDGLHYLCRAITPPNSPIRFSARFFIVDAARISGRLGGSGELENLRFYALEEALGMDLISITREILGELEEWLAMSEHDRLHRPHVKIRRTARWHLE
jgi:8-oxo-dGTP pyrophosphatase MutT (NUDIX family)